MSYVKILFEMNEKENVGESRPSLTNTPSKKKLLDNGNNISLLTNGSFVDQTKLLCCTGPDNHCPVHEPKDNKLTWGYLNSPDELETLIDRLNSRGFRESELKKMLLQEKPRILSSMEKCTKCLLNPSLVSDSIAKNFNIFMQCNVFNAVKYVFLCLFLLLPKFFLNRI